MRAKLAVVLFIIVLAFLFVFSWAIFNKLFVEIDPKFAESASAAFLGAFLAFIFVRLGDFFKSYSDRTTKHHSALIKLEHSLNGLIAALDDRIYVIETFEDMYKTYSKDENKSNVFIWANKLHLVAQIDEVLIDLLNVDLINELFSLNIGLRKLNESMDTINTAYFEAKEALLNNRIQTNNYLDNVERIHHRMIEVGQFTHAAMEEAHHALAAVRVLAKKRPLMGYALKILVGHKYGKRFQTERAEELIQISREIENIKKESQIKINKTLNR